MSKPWLIGAVDIIFVIGTLLFFVGFFTVQPTSLYPMMLFLVSILAIRLFHRNIKYLWFSLKDGLKLEMFKAKAKRADADYEKLIPLKKKWNYFEEENKHVR